MRKFLFLFAFISFSFASFSQENKTASKKFFDLPGAFTFDIGHTNYLGAEDTLEVKIFNSRGLNISYMYEFPVLGSRKFSFSPGFGVSNLNYAFKDNVTFTRTQQGDVLFVYISDTLKSIKKTKLSTTFLEIPVEFRFKTKAEGNSFRFALGAKAGLLATSHTKYKYRNDGNVRYKFKDDFDLTKIRYGVYARAGYSYFQLFAYYSLNKMFEKEATPYGKEMTPVMVGISISPK
jgi:hypothetical protein